MPKPSLWRLLRLPSSEPPGRLKAVNAEGGRHKASGVVVAVDPPKSVEFTWGWYNDNDERG